MKFLKLRIAAEHAPATAAHVLGHKTGRRECRIALMAHFDTKLDTPGAWDNAAGVAALIALAERFARSNLDCGLEFIAFADEENFSQDHVVYIDRRGDRFDTLLAAINMDGIAHILGHNTITMMSHSDPFEEVVRDIANGFRGVEWVAPWPQSNHATFAYNGVPAIALSSSTDWRTIAHQPEDTPQWISAAQIGEVVDLVAEIITAVASRSLAWTRPVPGGSGGQA